MSFCYYCSYHCCFQFIVNTLFIAFLTGLVNSHSPQDPLPPGFDCSKDQQTLDRCQPSEKSPESDLMEEVATRGFNSLLNPSHFHTYVQLPTHSSTHNSVRHLLLNPSLSHTKCPTTKTQRYIQFSTPLPADPLTLPHIMSNYQHTAVHTIQ